MIRPILALAALCALLPFPVKAQYAETTPAAKMPPSTPGIHLSYSSVHPDGPYIALTFDDGPSDTTTPRLLDILAKRGIKVTFFVLGENAKKYPAIIKRQIAEGHEIANHSWNHENFAKKTDEGLRAQIVNTQDAVFQIAGIKPKLLRPPYGAITERQKKLITDQYGLKVILWEVDPNDWKKPGSSVVARRIIDATRPGSIILSHDIHAQTVDAMAEVLDGLTAKGFKFVTVSELIAMDRPVPKPAATAASPAQPQAAKTN